MNQLSESTKLISWVNPLRKFIMKINCENRLSEQLRKSA